MKLSDEARKPSDILSDPSGNSLSDQSVLVSDWTVTLSEVNVQRFRCCREENIARVSIARETLIFFLRRKCNLRYAWPCFQIYGNRVYQSEYIVLILICVHTYFRAKLTSKSSDIIIHFVRPKLKGIGHFVRQLCKKYFKACMVQRKFCLCLNHLHVSCYPSSLCRTIFAMLRERYLYIWWPPSSGREDKTVLLWCQRTWRLFPWKFNSQGNFWI